MTRACTDLGNGERIADLCGGDVRFVAGLSRWIIWDGSRWKIDETRAIEARAKGVVRSIIEEAKNAESPGERADLLKHAVRSESDGRIRAAIARAEAEASLAIHVDELDASPWLLNVANGTLDLRLGAAPEALRPHDRRDLLTKLAPIKYDPAADCPLWLAFLDQIFLGRADIVGFMQEAAGYSLTGDVGEQCLFFCHGGGQNGKSTIFTVLRTMLGDYGMVADFSLLIEQRNSGPRNDIARLAGARFVSAIEVGQGQRLSENVVKNLTGGDKLVARLLYREPFEFLPTFKLWLAANHKPVVRGTDLAIWRRMRMIPFDYRIPDDEKVPNFENSFKKEWPGILNWALAGIERWRERGSIAIPEPVKEATRKYREDSDVIGQFLEERCEFGRGLSESHAALYAAYVTWARASGEPELSGRKLGNALEERNVFALRANNHSPTRRLGLRLRPHDFNGSGSSGGDFAPREGEIAPRSQVEQSHMLKDEPGHDGAQSLLFSDSSLAPPRVRLYEKDEDDAPPAPLAPPEVPIEELESSLEDDDLPF